MKWRKESDRSLGVGQVEMRYNLATKVMRNGVEVIVATDRNAKPVEPEYLRLLSSTVTRPITLAPHTLTNLMSMVLPTGQVTKGQSQVLSFLQPTFITKTYYTTYNYLTTVLKDNTTEVSNTKTTVTNVKTEEYKKTKSSGEIQPTETQSITFQTSPTFQTEVYHTAYTYLNTFLDGNQPFVLSSTHTVANTQVGTEENFNELEPSEVFPTSNTYLKTIEFTKTLTDGTDFQIVTTKDVMTQLVVTDKPEKKVMNVPITTDVTKTYFVTYTYFSTYIDGDQTKVKSDVSVSSDVTIEKFYIKPKKTETLMMEKIRTTENPIKVSSTDFPFNIFATKTYFTTFTYFTTLLQGPNSEQAETKINSRTKVVENTVTETISLQDITSEDLLRLNSSMQRITGSLIATATLKKGDRIIITAHRNLPIVGSYEKYEIKPTETMEVNTQTERHDYEYEEPDLLKIKPNLSKSSSTYTKSKTVLLNKQKVKPSKPIIDRATAEALIGTEEEIVTIDSTPTITLIPSISVIKTNLIPQNHNSYSQSAKISPTFGVHSFNKTVSSEKEIESGQEEILESSAFETGPELTDQKPPVKQPNHQTNTTNLLSLNSLGINGMNVLKPVFSAIGELIQNNLNTKGDMISRRNDTVGPLREVDFIKKPSSANVNPLLNFVNKFSPASVKGISEPKNKVTTPRTPVYIPVGSFAQDTEFSETQDSQFVIANRPDNWHEKWKNTQGKNFEKGKPQDTPITILEGGIPISPGQVITTNSDVIIGRPGESGPRPPTFAVKSNVPVDMKPPPPPHVLLKEDDHLGQHSTNQGVDFEHIKDEFNKIPARVPFPPPKKPHFGSHSYKLIRPHPGVRIKGTNHHKNSHFGKHTHAEYDSGTMDLNPPPKPPPPPVRTYDIHRPITINHEEEDSKSSLLSIPTHLGPNQNVEHYVNPAELNPGGVSLPTSQIVDPIGQGNILPILSEPTTNLDLVNPNILLIPTVAHLPLNLIATTNPIEDRSTGQQLLVNIQPSQVANIVIPHGSSTALIVSGGKQHSLKGEVIDDPSPHPEPETVGFVGAEPVLKIEGDNMTPSLHNEVISAGAEVAKQNSHTNRILFSNRPQLTTELIKIRPKPNFSDVRLPDQHSLELESEQHSQHLHVGQDQFGHHSLPTPQISHPTAQIYQVPISFENHRQTENNFQGSGIPLYNNHQNEGHDGSKDSAGIYLNQNHNAQEQNVVKGTNQVSVNQNYRKEGQNLNIVGTNLFNDIQVQTPQVIQNEMFVSQQQHPGHEYFLSTGGLYPNSVQVGQEHNNLIKGDNGIYVDISPPGHLPPRPEVNLLIENYSSGKYQGNFNENLANHQSGVVHDVPLNAQVQLGSGQKKENPLKEILISANTNKHDNIYNGKEKPLGSVLTESQNHIKQSYGDLPENLSPPPLPKKGSHSSRPAFITPRPTTPVQKFPPHFHPSSSQILPSHSPAFQMSNPHRTNPGLMKIPHSYSINSKVSDFMVPPRQVPNKPKPHSNPRPIPIGAGAPQQNYPSPKPEDILIVPPKNRPVTNYHQTIKHEIVKQPNIHSDIDLGGASEPIKTEYGEEIQESISRPLFPGQLPSELQLNQTHLNNHKIPEGQKPSNEISQNKDSDVKTEISEQSKPEIITDWIKNTGIPKDPEVSDDSILHWSLNQKVKQETSTGGTKDPSALNSFLNFGKKPSGFVSGSKEIIGNNHQTSASSANYENLGNPSNHRPNPSKFESLKFPTGNRGTLKYGSNKDSSPIYPSGFVTNKNTNANTNIGFHAVEPQNKPSGFVKTENTKEEEPLHNENKGELHTEESNQGSSVYTTTVKNENEDYSNKASANSKPYRGASLKQNKTIESNVESKKKTEPPKAVSDEIIPSSHFTNVRPNKSPNRYGTNSSENLFNAGQAQNTNLHGSADQTNSIRRQHGTKRPQNGSKRPTEGSKISQSSLKPPHEEFETYTSNSRKPESGVKKPQDGFGIAQEGAGIRQSGSRIPQNGIRKPPDGYKISQEGSGIRQSGPRLPQDEIRRPQEGSKRPLDSSRRPTTAIGTADSANIIRFDSNRISLGYPSGVRGSGSNEPTRFSSHDVTTNQEGVVPPGEFTTIKSESDKTSGGTSFSSNKSPSVFDSTKEPQKFSTPNKHIIKSPYGFPSNNETSVLHGVKPNHRYENKTINFYDIKPSIDLNEDRDVTYSNAESVDDKWFTNFGNVGSDDKIIKPTKLPTVPQRNATFQVNGGLSTDSNIQITVLTPPKISEMKPEEVMGLSPPPLERPRRPQRPRPQSPYKFEIPATPKSTIPPIAIENDFPPVRSPEFNRKPLKPQDIFPPKLPDNFVHHLPEYPIRNVPKPRPQERPVTSLPIDVPGAITKKPSNIYSSDLEDIGGKDTYFSGSEINGHSKPITDKDNGLSSLGLAPQTTPKRPNQSATFQPTIKLQTTKTSDIEVSSSTSETAAVETSETQTILPTPTQDLPPKTTYHTKVSTSVTPAVAQVYKDWHENDVIVGSETIFDSDQFNNHVTPTIKDISSKKNIITTLISTGSTTIFGNLYTQRPQGSSEKSSTAKTTVENIEVKGTNSATSMAPTKTIVPVYTTTLTVTTTMTTVLHSIGHKPFTKTIVLTKTLISTVFNKITETKTLVKPTTATIIQTHTVATTKTALVVPTALFPTQTKYPTGGTLKPEIFMADPHAKDTMTISVSSSMNNNKNGNEKRKNSGTKQDHSGKDSIFVVMSDKDVTDSDDDVMRDDGNEISDSRVVVGGVFDANEEKDYKETECVPGCKAKRNELCQRIEGVMKCVCRPGFARMFPDRPCRPTYTYNVKLMLEKLGSEKINFKKNFGQTSTPNMAKLASATKEGLDRMIMQSDLRDVYHGVMVNGFQGKDKKTMVDFYVQLSENTNETKLMDIFKKTLQTSNYSLGGTELFAAREADNLNAEDFNECLNPKFHDCSENARCFNLKGTYTCSCKEGFTDLSENTAFPGRVCSDMIGCEFCGYRGACYSKGEDEITCECFQWYSGERCHINLKVLLIALVTIGAILLALLLVCAILTCCNRRSRSSTTSRTNGSSAGYLRYRGPSNQSLDRRAMIGDSSSESSVDNLPYICPPPLSSSATMIAKKKPALRQMKGPAPRPVPIGGIDQRDRSVTVMIPRAKYRPMPPLSPHLTMSTFSPDKHLSKTAAQIATEQKFINYLDGNTRPEERPNSSNTIQKTKDQQKSYDYKSPNEYKSNDHKSNDYKGSTEYKLNEFKSVNTKDSPRPIEKKKEPRVFEYEYKMSNMLFSEETNSTDKRSAKSGDDRFRRHSDSTHLHSDNNRNFQFRKYSAGALVSAGYEVSAKVGMHHLEDDTTEDDQSGIINTHTMKSNRSQFTTLNRTGDHKTMSEARSYDETTVHPQTRSLKTHYSGSSPSSRVNNDEGHTMIERDLGSTFIMQESQLFKPDVDRGSDISNFDSL